MHIAKTEQQVLKLKNLNFYKRFVEDIINIRQKYQLDEYLDKLKIHHPRINYTTEMQT